MASLSVDSPWIVGAPTGGVFIVLTICGLARPADSKPPNTIQYNTIQYNTVEVLKLKTLYLSDCVSFQVRQNNTGNILRVHSTIDHVRKYCTYLSCSVTSQLALFSFPFRIRTRLIIFYFSCRRAIECLIVDCSFAFTRQIITIHATIRWELLFNCGILVGRVRKVVS